MKHATAAHQARRELILAGHGATLSAAAEGDIHGAEAAAQHRHLCEIAAYIQSDDPTEIVAAFLLEQSGHDRSQLSLLDSPSTGSPSAPSEGSPSTSDSA